MMICRRPLPSEEDILMRTQCSGADGGLRRKGGYDRPKGGTDDIVSDSTGSGCFNGP